MDKDPSTLVDLTGVRNEFEANILVEALRDRGIPAFAINNAGATLQWEVAASNPFRVTVRNVDLEAAREAIRVMRSESVDIDWSEVDVGTNPEEGVQEQLDDPPRPYLIGWLAQWGGLTAFLLFTLWLIYKFPPLRR